MKKIKKFNDGHEIYEHEGSMYSIRLNAGYFTAVNQLDLISKKFRSKNAVLNAITDRSIIFQEKGVPFIGGSHRTFLAKSITTRQWDSISKMLNVPMPKNETEKRFMLKKIKSYYIFCKEMKKRLP